MSPTPEQWLELLAPHDRAGELHALAMLAVLGIPPNFLDLGSGTGVYVNVARKLGVEAYGIDTIPRPDSWLLTHDLRKPFDLKRTFKLISCLEVVEHMRPENVPTLLASISKHLSVGGHLVWSAAHPGQGGDGHATLWPSYRWRSEFFALGIEWDERMSLRLSKAWTLIDSEQMWMSENVMVFGRPIPQATLEAEEEK